MKPLKPIILDANILLRGVFGIRVYQLLESHNEAILFQAPDICFRDAARNIPLIANQRDLNPEKGLQVLDQIAKIVEVVDQGIYEIHETRARARISVREPDDWPIVATALLLNAPIWTQDQDFFGCGIATWTTDRVQIYLRDE